MNHRVRESLTSAAECLQAGSPDLACAYLYDALQHVVPVPGNGRLWSKIMLAIRATKRAMALQESTS